MSRLPGEPAAEQHFQIGVAEAVLIMELLRHTGAFLFGRSLAVRHYQLVSGQFTYSLVDV
jgi:hypothetical protein